MTRRHRPTVAGPVLLVCLLAGCSAPPVPSAASTHTVRGVVRQLPTAGGVPFLVTHEAIEDLVDANGQPAPMPAMTMPFTTAADLDTSSLVVGDKVVLTLVVDWNAPAAVLVTAIEVLPADTALALGGG